MHPSDNLRFELGVTRTFGTGDLSDKILLSGWSESEANHVWNDGIEAALYIRMQMRPEQTVTLKLEGIPFVAGKLRKQDMTLFVNGHRLGFWRLDAMNKYLLNAEIDPEHWATRNGNAYAKCVWHLPDSARPSDVNDADDRRLIGFCFQAITIAP